MTARYFNSTGRWNRWRTESIMEKGTGLLFFTLTRHARLLFIYFFTNKTPFLFNLISGLSETDSISFTDNLYSWIDLADNGPTVIEVVTSRKAMQRKNAFAN